MSNGGVTASEIIESLENVKLVSRKEASNASPSSTTSSSAAVAAKDSEQREVWLLPYSATDASIGMKSDVKECCICMSDFPIHSEADLEDGLSCVPCNDHNHKSINATNKDHNNSDGSNSSDSDLDHSSSVVENLKECIIVRTRCGHVFHKECLSGWIGGRWQLHSNVVSPTATNNTNTAGDDTTPERRRRRARQTCCPLCREDLRPSAVSG